MSSYDASAISENDNHGVLYRSRTEHIHLFLGAAAAAAAAWADAAAADGTDALFYLHACYYIQKRIYVVCM